jgi:carboxypeptidase D
MNSLKFFSRSHPNYVPFSHRLPLVDGGPGCSSMDGLWLENGPFRLVSPDVSGESDWSIQINPSSWHASPAFTLYIDQPVGTGLSFTKSKSYCKNDFEIDTDFHLFLENFLIVHKDMFLNPEKNADGQYTMKRPLYFSGESHAGHYIPSMIDFILQKNADTKEDTRPRVLIYPSGAAIGNGWTDPYYQYAGAEAAYGVGMIDLAQKEELDHLELSCQAELAKGLYSVEVCDELVNKITAGSNGRHGTTKVSVYDNRKWESKSGSRSFPEGHKDVEKYLGGWSTHGYPKSMKVNYKDVLKAINAEESIGANQRFEECTDPPYYALAGFDGLGVVDEVVRILEHATKPKLLFFNGVNDIICNHAGNERMLVNLPWMHRDDWVKASRFAWNAFPVNGNVGPSGYMKEFENLLFLKVMASGHMVPMDQPEVSLEMMRTFMFSGSFDSMDQAIDRRIPSPTTCDCSSSSEGCGDDKDCTCPLSCPDCTELTCNCPTCESQNPESPSSFSSNANSHGMNDLKSSSYGSSMEGLFGISVGVLCTIFFMKLRSRYRVNGRNNDYDKNDMEALQSPDRYTDNPQEIELDSLS